MPRFPSLSSTFPPFPPSLCRRPPLRQCTRAAPPPAISVHQQGRASSSTAAVLMRACARCLRKSGPASSPTRCLDCAEEREDGGNVWKATTDGFCFGMEGELLEHNDRWMDEHCPLPSSPSSPSMSSRSRPPATSSSSIFPTKLPLQGSTSPFSQQPILTSDVSPPLPPRRTLPSCFPPEALEWPMAELLRHPNAMAKAWAELIQTIESKRQV